MNRKSLVLRLSAGFAATTLVLVGLGSGYLYFSLKRILLREAEDELRRSAGMVIRRLEEPGGGFQDLGQGCQLRILGRHGQLLLQSQGMPGVAEPGAGEALTFVEAGGTRFMVLEQGVPAGRVQVARDLAPEARRLRRFARALWATLGLTSLVAAIVGLWLSRRGLGPLRELAEQAAGIHPESLSTRLHLAQSPAELWPLVEALNRSLSGLETAFGRLSALNADLAHELRTPVHSLRLDAERMLAQSNLPPDVDEGLSGMMETLDHMGAMIGQMLFLARIEDPGAVLTRAPLAAGPLLQGAVEPFELLAEEAGVHLHVEAPAGLVVTGDGTLLRRALHNLIDNAIRHAPAATTVSVQAREAPGATILWVEDAGTGFPEAQRSLIGQRFLRSDPSRSQGTGGSGLGLAIVQSIMHLHGGRLDILSGAHGGTQAHLVLPRT